MKVLAFPNPRQEPPREAAEDAAPPPPVIGGGDGSSHYDRVSVRVITIAVVVSLFIHFAILILPLMDQTNQELKAPADEIGPLSVTIAGAKPQPPAPVQQPREQVAEKPTPTPPKPAAKPKPTPPRRQSQIAINSGRTPPFVVPPPAAPQSAPQVMPTPRPVVPTTDDFSEQLAARQRARRAENGGAPDEVLESDDARANRIAKGNIAAQQRSSSPGQDQSEAGGIFELKHTGLNEAEFVFNGWNRDFRRKLGKTYEVKQGNNSSIQLAVIRQMIEIIREVQPGDFQWYSYRLKGKTIIKSARPKDQADLEEFLMQEFYPLGPSMSGKPKR
ncbi:MAG: hypothetical protein ABI277_01375 [Burkholderiaceae bacterium]